VVFRRENSHKFSKKLFEKSEFVTRKTLSGGAIWRKMSGLAGKAGMRVDGPDWRPAVPEAFAHAGSRGTLKVLLDA